MARDLSLLSSPNPAAVVPAEVAISHVQLRDLIVCPKEAGVVNYVQRDRIVEQNLNKPNTAPRVIADLDFTPNTLTSLRVGPSGEDVLIAAGGQNADIHLSYHPAGSSVKRRPVKDGWAINGRLSGSINNSVALTTATSPCLTLSQSNESSIEPRVGVSNNDCTVRFYDVPLRGALAKRLRRNEEELHEAGVLRLDVPINHSSISPDGQTLLSVGDSNKVYIHSIRGGSCVSFSHIVTYSLPPADYSAIPSPPGSLVASFSTAFSGDGLKFAVASQEGVVAVWDIRSSKPLKVIHTEKTRAPGVSIIRGNGLASGWLSDDPWDWSRGSSRAPGWSVRNVKFGGSPYGKEVLAFTEHTSLVHVVDARTFETHEIVQVPLVRRPPVPLIPTSASQPINRRTGTYATPTRGRFLQPPASSPLRRTSNARQHSFYSFPSPSPSPRPSSSARVVGAGGRNGTSSGFMTPPRPSIVNALGDAFRVSSSAAYSPPESIGDSTWRTLHGLGRNSPSATPSTPPANQSAGRDEAGGRMNEQENGQVSATQWGSDLDDIVVIPPLGDTEVESEVHALLEIHGLTPRRASLALNTDPENDDEDDERDDQDEQSRDEETWRRRRITPTQDPSRMEVEESESNCTSRSGSPMPTSMFSANRHGSTRAAHIPYSSPPPPGWTPATGPNRIRAAVTDDDDDDSEMVEDFDDSSNAGSAEDKDLVYEPDLDLAGMCFDPTWSSLYVASSKSVVEWRIKGADVGRSWWASGEWR